MPFTRAGDETKLRYVVSGSRRAEPVVLIQGLGADTNGWLLQRPALARRYRVIAIDNRGVGLSDKPPGPYDLEVMAADVMAVLDAEGHQSAHLVGASMGGVIAQIAAVRHADRVRSLVLACTACRHLPWRRDLLDEWATIAGTEGMGALARRAVRWLVGPRSLRRFWPAVGLLGPLAVSAPAHAFIAQIDAILAMDDDIRVELARIAVPTLVIVGSQDILTPVGDAEELAELIPGSRLAIVRGAAHGFMVEHATTFNREVLAFLATVPARADQPAASQAVAGDRDPTAV